MFFYESLEQGSYPMIFLINIIKSNTYTIRLKKDILDHLILINLNT